MRVQLDSLDSRVPICRWRRSVEPFDPIQRVPLARFSSEGGPLRTRQARIHIQISYCAPYANPCASFTVKVKFPYYSSVQRTIASMVTFSRSRGGVYVH